MQLRQPSGKGLLEIIVAFGGVLAFGGATYGAGYHALAVVLWVVLGALLMSVTALLLRRTPPLVIEGWTVPMRPGELGYQWGPLTDVPGWASGWMKASFTIWTQEPTAVQTRHLYAWITCEQTRMRRWLRLPLKGLVKMPPTTFDDAKHSQLTRGKTDFQTTISPGSVPTEFTDVLFTHAGPFDLNLPERFSVWLVVETVVPKYRILHGFED